MAQIKLELSPDKQFSAVWNGKTVILPSRPTLGVLSGDKRTVFNPVSRQDDVVEMTSIQGVCLVVYNKKRQQVFLGEPMKSAEVKDGAVIFREEYPQADTRWEARLTPVGDNGLDAELTVETSPNYWLAHFEVKLFDLNLENPQGDSGDIRSAYRQRDAVTGAVPIPANEEIRINYPDGPSMLVPAAVLQDAKLAVGTCLLGAHEVWRPTYGELNLKPRLDRKAYEVSILSGWSHINSFENFYLQKFTKHYRFRFADPKPVAVDGYLHLTDAKELWRDYMDELDRRVPVTANPPYDKTKNNIVITNFMMSAPEYVTPENPQGYLMNNVRWKEDQWEWSGEITAGMTNAQVKEITGGLGEEHTGKPVQWMKAWAEKNVRELKETNSLATIVFRTSFDEGNDQSGKVTQNDYVPETHLFHPDMEERMDVEDRVRDWDWVIANIRVEDAAGQLLLEKENVAIHAMDKSQLFQIARHLDNRQVLPFKAEDVCDGGKPFVEKAANLGPQDTLRDGHVLLLSLSYPAQKLVGLKPGQGAELEATAQVHDPALAGQKLKVKAEITGVQRAAIDVWAKTLSDADQEFGFLVREDFYVGTPWTHTFRTFDWSADWQYQLLKQRIQWNRERFGKNCRWFYLDVFADYTPQFVIEMLRSDFPDCFFFVEHPQDVTARQLQGWNWFGGLTDLERYVNPQALVGVLPDRILTGNADKDREILHHFWKQSNYVFMVHRSAAKLVETVAGT